MSKTNISTRQNVRDATDVNDSMKNKMEKRQNYCSTVKPLMLACPLFREPNKTAKLKGANINCRPKYDEITTVFRIVWF